jgi:hypothetical protein
MGGCNSRSTQEGTEDVSNCCMCDVKDRDKSIRRTLAFPIKPPVGFFSSVKKPELRPHKKEELNGHPDSEEVGKRKMMNRVLTVMLDDRRNSKPTSPEPEKKRGSDPRRSSSWIEVPDPLPGWTMEEQHAFLDILKAHPKAGRDHVQLELVMVKALKRIPTKTIADFQQCFKHLDASRIAFFGRTVQPR